MTRPVVFPGFPLSVGLRPRPFPLRRGRSELSRATTRSPWKASPVSAFLLNRSSDLAVEGQSGVVGADLDGLRGGLVGLCVGADGGLARLSEKDDPGHEIGVPGKAEPVALQPDDKTARLHCLEFPGEAVALAFWNFDGVGQLGGGGGDVVGPQHVGGDGFLILHG